MRKRVGVGKVRFIVKFIVFLRKYAVPHSYPRDALDCDASFT